MAADAALAPPLSWRRQQRFLWPARLRRIAILAVIVAPSIVTALYYGLVVTDRYVSEAVFVLRTGNRAANSAGLSSLLTMLGLGRSQSDAQAVKAYLTSHEAINQLAGRLPLAKMFDDPSADLLSRYPSPLFAATHEGLYRYMQTRLAVRLDEASGLETLRVEAFSAADARAIAAELLVLAEQRVNDLNERGESDAVGRAADDLAVAEQLLVDSQIALTAFRNRELMIDATQNATALVEIIVKLSGELAKARVDLAQAQSESASSPLLPALRAREQALLEQIRRERGRVSSGSDGLAEKIAEYERLDLQNTFADRAVMAALAALDLARSDARRQHVFLERVVAPDLPDEARAPRRLATIVTVFGLNVIGFGVVWLVFAGLREHGRATRGD